MPKQDIATATPKLRFPEFRKSAGWRQTSLGLEATFQKGRGVSKAELDPNGDRLCIRYGELYTRYGEVISAVASRTSAPESDLFLSRKNDVIIPASGETKEDIATASCVLLDGVAIGSDLNVIRTTHNGIFLSYLLNGPKRKEIARVAQGDTVVHLYPSQLESLQVAFPEKVEQQKIADCLTSLDEVIAAQGREVEALKRYKLGLLQQLFPRKGEACPRFRFPEFRDAPEWQEKTLGKIANVKASGDLDSSLFSETRSDVFPYPVYSNAVERKGLFGYYSIPQYPGDYVTITARGTLGVAFFRDHEFMGVGRLLVVSDLVDVNPGFLTECWNHLAVISNEVTSIPQLTAVTARTTKLPMPSIEEQSRIADFLSFLDTQVAAEVELLIALKMHKQGLMQQIFPAPESD